MKSGSAWVRPKYSIRPFDDPISARIVELLRKPFPAQAIAIMGRAKRWQQARTGMVAAECGTGKTLIEEAIESSSVLIFGQRQGSLTGRRPREKPSVPEQATLFG
jgi:hypothetical protein